MATMPIHTTTYNNSFCLHPSINDNISIKSIYNTQLASKSTELLFPYYLQANYGHGESTMVHSDSKFNSVQRSNLHFKEVWLELVVNQISVPVLGKHCSEFWFCPFS